MRKAGTGNLEQAPSGKIGLMANDALRVEPYTCRGQSARMPIDETK